MLSVVIITLNEEAKIKACLESVAWADEIIVVDSLSTDRTVEMARIYTEKVYQREFAGFGEQKNYALLKARGDWILSLDADERVTDALRIEIQRTLQHTQASGFYVPLRYYLPAGRRRHHGWRPVYKLRLFRRDGGRFSDRLVHEDIKVDGPVEKLKSPMEHHPCYSMSTLIKKVDRYSTLGAELMVPAGTRCSCFSALIHSIAAFVKTYFFSLGFLDGWMGLAIAYSDSAYVFYKYMKCLELKNRQNR